MAGGFKPTVGVALALVIAAAVVGGLGLALWFCLLS